MGKTGGYCWLPTPNLQGIVWTVVTRHDLGCITDPGHDAPGPEAVRHADEIGEFAKVIGRDEVIFQSLIYQDVILSLAKHQRAGHEVIVDILLERYL